LAIDCTTEDGACVGRRTVAGRARIFLEVLAARLGNAEFLPGMQHGANFADARPLHIRSAVDAQTRDALMPVASLKAHLFLIDSKAAGHDGAFQCIARLHLFRKVGRHVEHGERRRKDRQIAGEGDVVGVTRVVAAMSFRETQQAPVEGRRDEIGENR